MSIRQDNLVQRSLTFVARQCCAQNPQIIKLKEGIVNALKAILRSSTVQNYGFFQQRKKGFRPHLVTGTKGQQLTPINMRKQKFQMSI